MIQIRPVSDLRNKFPEIEKIVVGNNTPVYFTKNGYGTMVVLSLDKYSELIEGTKAAEELPDFKARRR
jgi:prevent-host-death family protein